MWIYLVLLYGVLKGVREICKKKALETSPMMEILFIYSLISFLVLTPDAGNAMGLPTRYYGLIAIKSFIIFIAWICSFKAIKKLPISLYGVLDLSRVLFASLLGITVLGERPAVVGWIGLLLVCLGLLLLKVSPSGKKGGNTYHKKAALYVFLALVSCLLNALSGLLDKLYMRDINSSQLQFWYMLFLVLMYLIFILVTRQPIRLGRAIKNPWIWILSLMFVVADRALFIANADPASKVTVMTLLKQAGAVVTILSGRLIFKEKGTLHKLLCALVIIAGIVLGTIG